MYSAKHAANVHQAVYIPTSVLLQHESQCILKGRMDTINEFNAKEIIIIKSYVNHCTVRKIS